MSAAREHLCVCMCGCLHTACAKWRESVGQSVMCAYTCVMCVDCVGGRYLWSVCVGWVCFLAPRGVAGSLPADSQDAADGEASAPPAPLGALQGSHSERRHDGAHRDARPLGLLSTGLSHIHPGAWGAGPGHIVHARLVTGT